ncbi:MAG: hypothetical protein QOH24_2345 [Verrucomicrobiota bacterium]|jgi:uncharacterized protein (DUF697 family)
MNIEPKATIVRWIAEARREIGKLGGWGAFKSGEWLPNLVRAAFKAYYDNANPEYLRKKYPRASDKKIISKLTTIAARNAAIVGGITGAAVSIDEILALIASAPTGGLNLPMQITAAATALACEAVVLIRIQLHLIAQIAKLLNVPLDPDDPEDLHTILGFALGGAVAEEAGKQVAKVAGGATRTFIKKKITKETLVTIKKWGAKVGIKVLQRSIIKFAVPLASIAIGSTWNYLATMRIGGIATNHFRSSRKQRRPRAPKKTGRRG